MNALKRRLGLISFALVLPAVLLSTCGISFSVFGIEAADRLLDALMAHAFSGFLLSPFVVLGGPLVAIVLNAWQVFGLSADSYDGQFVIALSVKHAFGRLLWLALAGGLVLLLLTYAFVENFRIITR